MELRHPKPQTAGSTPAPFTSKTIKNINHDKNQENPQPHPRTATSARLAEATKKKNSGCHQRSRRENSG